MSIRSNLGLAHRSALIKLFRRDVALGDLGPVVTFTFDDCPRSALTLGAPILERFRARATFYVSMGLLGQTGEVGEYFAVADLRERLERGHEIANHGFHHLSARGAWPGRFMRDVEQGRTAIEEALGGIAAQDFAYPYGAVTLLTKARIGRMARSCRGVSGGFNGPVVDLNFLRATPLFGDVNFEEVRQLIQENERRKGWLIFFSHDVSSSPSPYGCTPELLEFAISFALDRNLKIMSVGKVLSRICDTQPAHFINTASP